VARSPRRVKALEKGTFERLSGQASPLVASETPCRLDQGGAGLITPQEPDSSPPHERAFAAAIRAARVESGLTQVAVAERVGPTLDAGQSAEQGARRTRCQGGCSPSLRHSAAHWRSW
jgi:hypothetical protein